MLWEANRNDSIDSDSQDGDEQMDKCDPVGKKGPGDNSRTISGLISPGTGRRCIK